MPPALTLATPSVLLIDRSATGLNTTVAGVTGATKLERPVKLAAPLLKVPAVDTEVTGTVIVQLAVLAAIVPFANCAAPEPRTAVSVPLQLFVDAPAAIVKPAGKVSRKSRLACAGFPATLLSTIVNVLVAPTNNGEGENDLVIVGGCTTFTHACWLFAALTVDLLRKPVLVPNAPHVALAVDKPTAV